MKGLVWAHTDSSRVGIWNDIFWLSPYEASTFAFTLFPPRSKSRKAEEPKDQSSNEGSSPYHYYGSWEIWESKAKKEWAMRSVLLSSRCQNKIDRLGDLHNRNLFLIILGAEKSKVKMLADSVPGGRVSSWLGDDCHLAVSSPLRKRELWSLFL